MSMLLDISNNPWVGSIASTIMWGNAYAGSDQRIGGGPCCFISLISIYVQQTSHLYRALPQRKDSPKDLPATRRLLAKVVHMQASAVICQCETEERVCRAIAKHQSLLSRTFD